jgi:hypothetical protein
MIESSATLADLDRVQREIDVQDVELADTRSLLRACAERGRRGNLALLAL